jgi:hypothetical protein
MIDSLVTALGEVRSRSRMNAASVPQAFRSSLRVLSGSDPYESAGRLIATILASAVSKALVDGEARAGGGVMKVPILRRGRVERVPVADAVAELESGRAEIPEGIAREELLALERELLSRDISDIENLRRDLLFIDGETPPVMWW